MTERTIDLDRHRGMAAQKERSCGASFRKWQPMNMRCESERKRWNINSLPDLPQTGTSSLRRRGIL
jgi:hypothetical protein